MERKQSKQPTDAEKNQKNPNGRTSDGLELIKMILDDNPALKERVLQAVGRARDTKVVETKSKKRTP